VQAAAEPAEDVAAVRLRFTTDGSKGWFTIQMSGGADGGWQAVLPRPRGGLRRFRYQIEAASVAAESASTPETVVQVVKSAADCPSGRVASTAVPTSSLLVEGPPNGPRKNPPLVPAGFSRVGVAGHIGVFDLTTPVAVLGATVAGAGVAAAAVTWGKKEDFTPVTAPPPPPGFEFALVSSNPAPGSTVSLRSTPLALAVGVTVPRDLGPGTMRVFLLEAGTNSVCVSLGVRHGGLRAGQSQTLTVSGPPFSPSPLCGTTFATGRARIVLIESTNEEILSTGPYLPDLDVSYSFVP
jgi:hypothetical protein